MRQESTESRALIAVLAIEALIWLPEEVGAENTFRLCSRKAQNQDLNHGLGDWGLDLVNRKKLSSGARFDITKDNPLKKGLAFLNPEGLLFFFS